MYSLRTPSSLTKKTFANSFEKLVSPFSWSQPCSAKTAHCIDVTSQMVGLYFSRIVATVICLSKMTYVRPEPWAEMLDGVNEKVKERKKQKAKIALVFFMALCFSKL